jgi:hypothetical protein
MAYTRIEIEERYYKLMKTFNKSSSINNVYNSTGSDNATDIAI